MTTDMHSVFSPSFRPLDGFYPVHTGIYRHSMLTKEISVHEV
ncbi:MULTISPECIES: hypothetical protein [Porphyromonas]|nr:MULTISPECIES: hypothetical protein [Porphyromonas]